jgi:hypothetical protein
MKRMRTFFLHCMTASRFTIIREYLMSKYSVYTAIFVNGYATFRIAY